jgi:hypothetical protein
MCSQYSVEKSQPDWFNKSQSVKSKRLSARKAQTVLTASTILLKDERGNIRMSLEASDAVDNSRITIFGRNGESICLTTDADSTCMIGLLRKDGTMAAAVSLNSQGDIRLVLSDKTGSHVLRADK